MKANENQMCDKKLPLKRVSFVYEESPGLDCLPISVCSLYNSLGTVSSLDSDGGLDSDSGSDGVSSLQLEYCP